MTRIMIAAAMILTAAMARADPAIHLDVLTCAFLDSTGQVFEAGAGKVVLTPNGTNAGKFTCIGRQDFPAGHSVRYDAETQGGPCLIVSGDGVRATDKWFEQISASGRITLTCIWQGNQ